MKRLIVLFFVVALLAKDHLSMSKPLANGDAGAVARQLNGGFLAKDTEEGRDLKSITVSVTINTCGCPEGEEHTCGDDDDDDLPDIDDGNQN